MTVTPNVPLNTLGAAPVMVTDWPLVKPCEARVALAVVELLAVAVAAVPPVPVPGLPEALIRKVLPDALLTVKEPLYPAAEFPLIVTVAPLAKPCATEVVTLKLLPDLEIDEMLTVVVPEATPVSAVSVRVTAVDSVEIDRVVPPLVSELTW